MNQNGDFLEDIPSPKVDPSSDDGSIDKIVPGKTQRISNLKSRVKSKTKKVLGIDNTEDESDSESKERRPLQSIDNDPAFNPTQLSKQGHDSPSTAAKKTKKAVKKIGTTIAHPIDTTKSAITRTTAGQLSKAERPYLSQKSDLDFLEAHDNLKQLESSSSSRKEDSDDEQDEIIGNHKDKIREMEAHRESLRVAWTTNRHVRRVRVVPKRHINFPEDEYFVERDANGRPVRYDWLKWLGYNLIYYTQDFSAHYIDDFDDLPFSVDSSRHYTERIVMASAPWQSWAMSVRSVYRWEDPKTTGKWFALYVLLWYTNHVIGFLYLYIIYIVTKNRFYPSSIESLRSSIQRAQDSRSTAYKFGELIDKHGRSNWMEPLLADLGPYIQLQLGDVANMLEVFSNFYHWKSPRKTIGTLIFFASCLAVTIFADMAFCMKIVFFIAGGSFFLCFPIASRYPKYRYLVSPFKWVLWDIPTNAEWSFQYLRRNAQEAREKMIEQKVEDSRETAHSPTTNCAGRLSSVPKVEVEGHAWEVESTYESDDSGFFSASSSNSILDSNDIRSFRAFYDDVPGRFVIFSGGIRFVRSLKTKELWRYSFLELMEMRKLEGTRVSMIPLSHIQMEITCIDGSRLKLEGMRERDEAFNTVIGFSSLQWQSLQIRHDTDDQES